MSKELVTIELANGLLNAVNTISDMAVMNTTSKLTREADREAVKLRLNAGLAILESNCALEVSRNNTRNIIDFENYTNGLEVNSRAQEAINREKDNLYSRYNQLSRYFLARYSTN